MSLAHGAGKRAAANHPLLLLGPGTKLKDLLLDSASTSPLLRLGFLWTLVGSPLNFYWTCTAHLLDLQTSRWPKLSFGERLEVLLDSCQTSLEKPLLNSNGGSLLDFSRSLLDVSWASTGLLLDLCWTSYWTSDRLPRESLLDFEGGPLLGTCWNCIGSPLELDWISAKRIMDPFFTKLVLAFCLTLTGPRTGHLLE